MPQTYLCFVWHMHQPFYKDLGSAEYRLPWTRLHALKDYYGMVKMLAGFPEIRQTFNLVPSMMVQIEDYASGAARDPFLRAALKPAEELTQDEHEFILRYFFQANISRMIYRYPRYGELFNQWRASDFNPCRARELFDARAYRDLQVLSQLAWFDEEFLEHDAAVSGLVRKERGYSRADQEALGLKQLEVLGKVLPVYREFASSGQIELSVTPYYHPILPLLCDSDIASVSHPNVTLPKRFRYPQDAREQVIRARDYAIQKLGHTPAGLWPSEGSVSDETLGIAAEAGFQWMATDNGVLSATLKTVAGPWETYQPYLWKNGGREMRLIFRDHYLSDLIGFVYSRMEARCAAQHFVDRIVENCRPILAAGRDALVPIVLDGENAWEHYDRGGREFLSELYRRITEHPGMTAVTVSEALSRIEPAQASHVFPGSWIQANFDIWIGAEEDNRAWELLREARETYDRVVDGPQGKKISKLNRQLAFEELLIAEGSDWFWWYGPEHHSENRPEFDKLFRDHLTQVYRALGLAPPDELSQPIVRIQIRAQHERPSAWVTPKIDGEVSSYFEWLGAGQYLPDKRQGAMHGDHSPVQALCYGNDATRLYLRLDLDVESAGIEVHVLFNGQTQVWSQAMLTETGAELLNIERPGRLTVPMQCRYHRVFEAAIDFSGLGLRTGDTARFQVSIWRDGVPIDALPAQGWIELDTNEPE